MKEMIKNDWKFLLSAAVNIITIVSFVLMWSYTSGQRNAQSVEFGRQIQIGIIERKEINAELKEQGNAITSVNSKLDLLLDHFNIANK